MAKTALQKSFAPAKKYLPRAIWSPLRALATALITPVRFSLRTGHWRSSLRMAAQASGGAPTPWYTYPAIDFLAQRNFSDRHVLEFGGGQSTLWWSKRARSVLTIEEDIDWFESLRSRAGENVKLHHVPADRKTRSVAEIKAVLDGSAVAKFDVIVIDGHLRKEVTGLAFDYLTRDGAIIIDNAEGFGIYEVLRERNCRRIDFLGFAPGVVLRHCTSVVFGEDCFLLRPDIPILDPEIAA